MIPAQTALVIAAHPDDEVLGAGGFMAHYPGTSVLLLTNGSMEEASRLGDYDERAKAKLAAAEDSAVLLSAIVTRVGEWADQMLTLSPALRHFIERAIQEVRPSVVLTHSPTDLNQDHRVVAEAVAVACRPYSSSGTTVKWLLGFEVDALSLPGLPPAYPSLSLPLSEPDLALKLAALHRYAEAACLRDWPHPRSLQAIEHGARWAGAAIGHPAAERYHLLWGQLP